MKFTPILFATLLISHSFPAFADSERTRLIILADMGNEPDEMQQMAHMLMCSNEFDLEGLIAVTGKYLRPERKEVYRKVTHPELFNEIIDAYEKIYPNLQKHAQGWHTPAYLRSIVRAGQKGYGIDDVGEGKPSPGSELILNALAKPDPRPIWIVVNAGSNTLAQALWDYRSNHDKREVARLVKKIRVFENGAQDNAGAWICNQFPSIHWIRSNYQTYAYGGPGGTDGDVTTNLGPRFWGDFEYSVSGQNDWLLKHVMNDHGPLGEIYPERRWHGFKNGGLGFMEGGGTIPWIGLVNKGLFDIDQPSWGGWSGRFSSTKAADFWSRHSDISVDEKAHAPFYVYRGVSDVWMNPNDGKTYYGDYVPVWRWREAMYNDFICRMDWSINAYEDANHHPVAAFHEDTSDRIILLDAVPGEEIDLDSSQSHDPDEDALDIVWWIYKEAGTYPGDVYIENPKATKSFVKVPTGAAGKQIHLILEIKDDNPIASLFDYRRIVINVSDSYEHSKLSIQR